MFWIVEGVGLKTKHEFKAWSKMVKAVGRGIVLPPPHYETELTFETLPEMSPEAERAGLACVAEALFKTLRAEGRFRRAESRVDEMESVLKSTRELIGGK